jgi:iron complex transport system permease protein
MQTGHDRLLAPVREEQRRKRKNMLLALGVLLILICFTLCLRTTQIGLIPPKDEILNLYTMVRLGLADLFHQPLSLQRGDIIAQRPLYTETVGRFQSTVLTVIAGGVLSLAGAVFQSVFRNPIAVPSMLGVTSGVNIGVLILVLTYSTAATRMAARGALICYASSFIILLLLLAYGRFLGGRKFSVVEILVAGTILTRLLSEIVTLIERHMTEDDLVTLQEITMYGFGLGQEGTAAVFLIPLLILLIPLFLMRFSMNAVSFPPEESRTIGLNTFALGIFAIICSTMMTVDAVMFAGDVGMMALLIPFICRSLFGVDFRNQFFSCLIFGAGFLLICRIVTVLLSFTQYVHLFTLSTVVTLISAPIFYLVIARGRKGWNA